MVAPADASDPLHGEHGVGIEAIALFRGADAAAVAEAIRDCEIRTLPAAAPLMRPGDANDNLFVLLSGSMVAYLDDAMLPEAGIPIRPGESVGEMSAIDGQPVSAFVVAVTEARLLVLPGAVFWNRLGPIPGISRNLLGLLAGRMRRSNESILEAQRKQFALESLRKELEIARQLQAGMIPLPGRLFPERADVEVAGLMEPAAEIGGDFFDAFFVDDRHLFICVGDVSGHGIPAALFMARTIGLIRITAMGIRSPDHLLGRINDQLCSGNDASIFVTLFCGFLDVASGRFVYANAGHCAPLVAGAGKSSWLPIPKGALVGAIPGLRYAAAEIVLDVGAVLICYTDGITEAEMESGGEFSEERLLSLGAANSDLPVEALLDALRDGLAAAIGAVALADDCTLLAVRRRTR
jgi:phosphoserine phosphatase RsbU/P